MLTWVCSHMSDILFLYFFSGCCLFTAVGGVHCYDYFTTYRNDAQNKKIQ